MATSGSAEFDKLKKHLDGSQAVRREVEFAFSALLTAANPSDRGLRFLFGNGAEWIMASAAWSAGVLTAPAGHNANGFDLGDLLDKTRALWSVKASASKKGGQIRLKNFMGGGKDATWDEPTLFVSPYYGGAVFIDPTSDSEVRAKARKGNDALILPGSVPKDYAAIHPESIVSFDVAVNDGAGNNDPFAFIKSVIDPAHFPNLSKPFLASMPPAQSNRVEEIEKLVILRDDGVLTPKQFEKAIERTLG